MVNFLSNTIFKDTTQSVSYNVGLLLQDGTSLNTKDNTIYNDYNGTRVAYQKTPTKTLKVSFITDYNQFHNNDFPALFNGQAIYVDIDPYRTGIVVLSNMNVSSENYPWVFWNAELIW
jgi:hypothetical protein